jgi:mono/diheme cytochrome c family protein
MPSRGKNPLRMWTPSRTWNPALAGFSAVTGALVTFIAVTAIPHAANQTPPVVGGDAAQYRAVLDQYCVGCHNDRVKNADLSLQQVDLTHLDAHAEALEKVIRKVDAGMMPPQGARRPDPAVASGLTTWLKEGLDRVAAAKPNPGRSPLRRLNRAEYGNAIRDLLELQVDVASLLPPDDSSYGFDNIADVLGSSPTLLERYLNAAGEISALAVGSVEDNVASSRTYVAPPDTTQVEHVEGLPIGTRGGLLINHTFPLDGEYLFKVRLWRNNSSSIRGLSQTHDVEISIDGKRVFLETIGTPEDYKALLTNPQDAEAIVDPRMQVRVPVTAGPHAVSVAFVFKSDARDMTLLRPLLASHDPISIDGPPRVDWVLIGGPFNPTGPGDTPSRRRLFVCKPSTGSTADETACARRVLSAVARRAYRRPVTNEDLDPLLEFYRRGRAKGSFEAGIALALQRVLSDPAFIFRPENSPASAAPGAVSRLSDVELASRLSFFLWSSIPDDRLLDLASRGRLSDRAVLDAEVRRMIADDKADAFVSNFAGQWLLLRNLQKSHPDTQEFPDFDDGLRQSLRQETEMLFGSVLRENHSLLELLNADYTFVNERLAEHYGIRGVYGSQFRRVPVPSDARRGLLGHGSVLTVTSYPNRTSPVLRGKWVLENLLGTPPPPPPPNVPPLAEQQAGTRPKTMREQLESHRANPACANCHKLMDPLGFALENFDGVGAWRSREGQASIDAASVLADGTTVDGVVALRQWLLGRPEMFVGTVTEKLLIYALGRGLTATDMPSVRAIVRDARPGHYAFGSIVHGVVTSTPFQMRIKP